MKKKNVIIMKKKNFCRKLNFGLLPKYIARLKKIVLQPEEKRKNRIARLVLYCNRGRL